MYVSGKPKASVCTFPASRRRRCVRISQAEDAGMSVPCKPKTPASLPAAVWCWRRAGRRAYADAFGLPLNDLAELTTADRPGRAYATVCLREPIRMNPTATSAMKLPIHNRIVARKFRIGCVSRPGGVFKYCV